MTHDEMQNAEIVRRLSDIVSQMGAGFANLNQRIDSLSVKVDGTNERVSRLERSEAVAAEKFGTLQREVSGLYRRVDQERDEDRHEREDVAKALSESKPITRRELTVASGSIVTAFAIIMALLKFFPTLVGRVTP
jgi:predicted nuclease with TOPRIM domain